MPRTLTRRMLPLVLIGLAALVAGCAAPTAPRQAALAPQPVDDRASGELLAAGDVQLTAWSDAHSPAGEPAVPSFGDEVPPAVDRAAPPPPAASTGEWAGCEVPIDLQAALEIAGGRNPQVAFARARVAEALARLEASEVLWLPSLRAGANYNKHEGRIQDVAGRMIETSRRSVYTGMGALAVGAGSPAVPGVALNLHLRDALFLPGIAAQGVQAREHAGLAVLNDTLLATALAYLDLLEAVQTTAVANQTLANAQQLVDLSTSFAETGQGLQADADRARTELSVREIELRRAEENSRVASIRLARLLSQDPASTLIPCEPALAPIELVAPDAPLCELLAIGLSMRPELGESQALVAEAIERLRRERYAPLVPSVLLGLSYGGNGGGLGGEINNFGDRLDFDAAAWWEIRNLGLGERALRNEARSRVELERWRQVQVLDQVAAEVAEAHAQVVARAAQIQLAEHGIVAARDSYRRNAERIRDGQGLPIETLQSIQALDLAQRQYFRAVADYNRAQFRLHRALGCPGDPPATME